MSLPQHSRRPADSALAAAIEAADISDGSRLLAAVSGGPDSTALLHALVDQSPRHGWAVCVAHINHTLRGAESAADEEFVRALADGLGLPVQVESMGTEQFARVRRMSVETAARTLRYEALRKMLGAWRGDVILTGHTLDDQAETVLMHLLRGSGLNGLTGMKPRTGEVVRPFLGISRAEVMQYLESRGYRYRLDSSNWDRKYARSRVRHDLLPTLAEYEPWVREHIASAASLLREDYRYLDAEAEALAQALWAPAGGINLAGFRSLHPALRRLVLRRLLLSSDDSGGELPARTLLELEERLCASSPAAHGSTRLGGRVELWIIDGRITTHAADADSPLWHEAAVSMAGDTALPVGTLSASVNEPPGGPERWLAVLGTWHVLFDADALGPDFTLRTRRPGDRMRPLGAPGRRKVQDIMVDARVPAWLRATWPLLLCGDEILWIPGVARSETALIGPGTTRVIHLRFRPTEHLYRGRIPRHFP